MRKRIAVLTYGGIGAGLFSQGYPMLVKIVKALAEKYEITVFSFVSPDKNFSPENYAIKSPPAWITWSPLRWIAFISVVLRNFFITPYALFMGFWVYPAGFIASVFGCVLRRPVIVNVLGAELADVPEIGYGQLRIPMTRKLINWTLRQATEVIAISRFQADIMKSLQITRPVHLIPWGADSAMFPFQDKSWEELRILHVANLNEVKDQATLIQAFALIRKSQPSSLRIVGGDFMQGRLQKLVKELNLDADIEFTGPLPYHEIYEQYRWANVMMHTSVYEGQCLALTEAAASGLLLAGTEVGLLYDLGNTCGIVVKPKQYQELAARILTASGQPELCREMVNRARAWSEKHDFQWTVDQFDRLMNRLTQRP